MSDIHRLLPGKAGWSLAQKLRGLVALLGLWSVVSGADAQTGTAWVRHAPSINGTVEGSVWMMTPESLTLNGASLVTGDLLVPGLPVVRTDGNPTYAGTLDGSGPETPANYQITLNGGATLRNVIRRTDPKSLPTFAAPVSPAGTRTVTLNSPAETVGAFDTLRNLTLNGNVGPVAVPPGAYGDFTANAGSDFVLGVAGGTQAVNYHFQRLTLNGQSQLQVVGPVVVNVANGFTGNGAMGSTNRSDWLMLRIASGGLTLNGGCTLHGFVSAPSNSGTVTINGNSTLIGGLVADRLIINGAGVLRLHTGGGGGPVNTAPVAAPQALVLAEDTSIAVSLTATDAENDSLTYRVATPPAHGTLSGTAPALTYTPNPNYHGSDSFVFIARDAALDSAPATVSLTITPVNDIPVAAPLTLRTEEDTPIVITLSGSDADGDTLSYAIITPPARGTLSGTPPALTYTPAPDIHGFDSFAYTVSDGSATSAPAAVSVEITPVNDRPVALAQSLSVSEGEILRVVLSATDADGDTLTYAITTPPTLGSLVLAPDSTPAEPAYLYTPPANTDATTTFAFTASDADGASLPATVSIAISNRNDPPLASGIDVALDEDTTLVIPLVATDADGESLTYAVATPPRRGTVSLASNLATYTPAPDAHGEDTFTFTASDGALTSAPAVVNLTIRPVNDAPVAIPPASLVTAEDTALSLSLAGTDVDGDALTYVITNPPIHGLLVPASGSSTAYTYTPSADYHGTDSFVYTVSDTAGASDSATVSIRVTPVNDAPVAKAAAYSVSEGQTLPLVLVATDVDGDALTYAITTQPTLGTLTGTPPELTYVPPANTDATVTFDFTASDGVAPPVSATITIEVRNIPDAPVAQSQALTLAEDTPIAITLSASDPEGDALTYEIVVPPAHGALSGTAPALTYTPNANFHGADSFTFLARDAALASAPAVVALTVTPVNDAPVAPDQALTTPEDTPLAIVLTATDADGDPLTYALTTPPAHGTLTLTPDTVNHYTYSPAANYHGADSLRFTVTDGIAPPVSAVISIQVTPVNDAPVAIAQTRITPEDTPLALTLSASDAEDDALTYTIVTPPSHGTLSGTVPALTYTPFPDYHGPDAFAFTASDGALTSASAFVSIEITPVNDAPTTADQTLALDEDQSGTVVLQAADADGDTLAFSLVARDGNIVTVWNAIALDAVRLASRPVALGGAGQAPPEISRALAIVQLAVFEAVNAIGRTYAPYEAPYLEPVGPVSLEAAAARAAHDALHALFPASRPLFASRLAQDLAAVSDVSLRDNGSLLGAAAAARVLALRVGDGSFAPSDYTPAPPGTIGAWQPADVALWGTANGGALRPEWGRVAPFVLDAPDQFAPPPPPAIGTSAYAAALNEIRNIGASTSPVRTSDQSETAYYWADGPGTYSPPGHWNEIATRVAARSDLSPVGTARLLALVNLANADVAIACWHSKYDHDLWRPVTAIRHPDDGSPLTESDPVWTPLLGTPQFPSYPSGHSAFSSASATVLAALLGDAVRVTVASEDPRAATRILHSLTAAADEAGRSRVLGGIHYEFDNIAGRDLGRDVANHILARALLPLTPEPPPSIQRGEAVLVGATLTYTPPDHCHGSDIVPFTVTDGQATAAARVLVTLEPVNDLPVAHSQAVSLLEDASAEVTLVATDADGDPLVYSIVTPPAHGTLSGVPPALIYVPAADYFGPDEFTFTAADANGSSAPAVVQFTVLSVNDAPAATPQSVSTAHYTALAIALAGSDADGDALTYSLVSQPLHGSLEPAPGGYLYRPRYAFWGEDAFSFTATDGALTSAPASVTITVTPPTVAVTPVVSLAPITPAPLPHTAFALRATALDADGSVVRVEFYEDGAPIGTLVQDAPGEPGVYALLLPSGRPAGTYTFTAKVHDDQGLSAVSAPLAVTLATDPRSRTFTTTADFNEGQVRTLNSESDQLTTSFFPSAYDFVWVVNSSKGTVVRLDSETARVVGEFRAGPEGITGFPSRIAIDSRGNAFVANRQTGAIVKIGLGADNGTGIDRNNNGRIDSSTGLGDVRPWPSGGAPTDEQITLYIETGVQGLEHMAIDANDNLWVGPYSGAWKLYDGINGELLRVEPGAPGLGGRGGFIDEDGIQVSTGPRFLHWDTAQPLATSANPAFSAAVRRNAWGVTKDFDGNYWVTEDWSGTIAKHAPDGTLLGSFYHGEPWAQGVTTGKDGHIWVAHSHCGYTVGHLLPDGTFLGNVRVANHGPTEVAVDRKGRVWVVSTTGVVERINPLGGPLGSDNVTPVGEVDVRSPNLGGTLWTFGNFVGNRSGLFLQDGQWRFSYDGRVAGSGWGPVQWNALLFNDAVILVEVALSDDGVIFGPWQTLTLESPVPAGVGRYLRGRVTFTPATTGESPVLYDLTVGTLGYPAPEPPRYWRVSAGDDIDANWPDTIQLKGAFGRSDHEFPAPPTYQWSLVSFSPLPSGSVGTAPAGGVPTFSDSANPRSTVTFNGVGDYVLRLTATLDGVVSTDDVRLHVTPFNKTPYVSAGEHVYLRDASDLVTLSGVARDDGLPIPANLTLKWETLFGPGNVEFSAPAAAVTDAAFTAPGVYVLRLTGDDGEFNHSATVTAWVGLVCRPPTPAGLVSWWQGNADGADHVGGNQSFPENGAGYAAGQVGPAFNFDGLNDRLLVFGNPSLDVGQGSGFTLEFWARPTEAREATLFQYGRDATTTGLTVRQSGATLIVNFRELSGLNHQVSVPAALPVNVWSHVAITYDRASGRASIYRNGIFAAPSNVGSFIVDTSRDLRVGGSWANNQYFKGQLDEVSLYGRALGHAEVWGVHALGAAGKRPPTSNAAPVVSAGPASGYTLTGSDRTLMLAGSVTDDGLPQGVALNTRWSVLTAPVVDTNPLTYATVEFADGTASATAATFSAPGIYTLRLYSDDGALCSEDTVEVRVAMNTAVETPDGLVAWWPGNRTTEEVVSGRTEPAVNVSYAAGKVGGGFSFDATNRHVLVQAPAQTNVGAFTSGFTLEFWINPPTTNDTALRRVLAWANGATEQTHVYGYGSELRINNLYQQWSMPLPSGWSHVAYVYDKTAARLRLYRNGSLVNAHAVDGSSATNFVNQTTGDFYLGGLPFHPTGTWFIGGLDEVALYNRPLSGSEVARIYTAGTSGKLPIVDNQPPTVSAGPDRALTGESGTTTLLGQASDDGLPDGALSLEWTQLFGPATATITTPHQAQTAVTLPASGLYGFELSGSDGLATRRDVVEVRVNSTTPATIPDGMVAWWPGNRTTEERVTGRIEPAVNMAYGAGKVGAGFSFDASDRHVLVQAPAQTNVGAFESGFTVEFWINPPTTDDSASRRVIAWANGSTEQTHIYRYGSELRIDNLYQRWSMALPIGWSHVAYVYDKTAARLRLYRNGSLVSAHPIDASSATNFVNYTTGDFYLGGLPFHLAGNWFIGGLDEVAIYNRPLSGSEVARIYTAGTAGKLPHADNEPPTVSAGPDRAVTTASGSTALLGQASDDGLPDGELKVKWAQLFGPATAIIATPDQAQTDVSLPAAGLYGFELSGSDGFETTRDVVEVRVDMTTSVRAPDGLVAWWPGNRTTEERVTGRSEPGVNVDYTAGKVGEGFRFDATNRQVLVQSPEQTHVGAFAPGFTLEFWINPPTTNDTAERRVIAWANGATEQTHIYRYGGELRIHNRYQQWSVALPIGWSHVAYVYDKAAARLRLYRNGSLVSEHAIDSTSAANFVSHTSGDLYFGGLPFHPAGNWFIGDLDEVAIYDRPLSGSELARIYTAGTSGKLPLADNQPPTVSAGPDRAVTGASGTTTLLGEASDDGLPSSPLALRWTQLFGPETAAIATPAEAQTAVTLPAPGLYGFELSGSDGFVTRRDVAEVRVALASGAEAPDGLVAWWPGNRTTEERVTGRMEAGVDVDYTAAEVGEGFRFDATNRHVLVQSPEQTHVGAFAPGFTLEFWINPPTTNDTAERRVIAWANGATEQTHIYRYGGELRIHNRYQQWSVALPIGWSHVAYVYDKAAARLRLYRNGSLVSEHAIDSTSAANFVSQTSGDLYFGGLPFRTEGTWFIGGLDEVSFYNRPLTNSEIARIYSAAAAGKLSLDGNQPPTVSAGLDRIVAASPGTATLLGQASDDGLPNGELDIKWTQLFGPAAATIAAPGQTETEVHLPAPGLYGFELSASDGFTARSDMAEVRVGMGSISEPPSGLVAWWPGNHTTEEIVTGRREAAVNIAYASGKVGGGFDFEATNRRVVVQSPEQTQVGAFAAGFTIEFWINPASATDSSLRRVIAWANGGVEQTYIYRSGGALRINNRSEDWSMALPVGWSHVAYVYDKAAARLRLYRNGSLVTDHPIGSVSVANFVSQTSGDLYFGGLPFHAEGNWFRGGLDEVSFYNRPLSAAEVAGVHSSGAAGKLPIAPPPVVQLAAPVASGIYLTGQPLVLQAIVYDRGSPVTAVEFYDGNTLLASVSEPDGTNPALYAITHGAGLPVGPHSITAKATSLNGGTTTSAPVLITVSYGPPVVTLLAPLADTVVPAQLPITLAASATYAGGSLAKVEFFGGTTKLGESTVLDASTGDYRLTLPAGLAPGGHVLTAKATAADGAVGSSAPISISAEIVYPTVAITAPTNGTQVLTGRPVTLDAVAAVPVGEISHVEFRRGATLLGTVVAPVNGSADLYRFVLPAGFSAGEHTLVARAVAATGASADSAPVTLTAVPYTGPQIVKLTTPTDSARISAPMSITGIVAVDALTSWKIEYRLTPAEGAPTTSAPWITLSTGADFVGTPAMGANPSAPGDLGTLDPTLLVNGLYQLRLSATTSAGVTHMAGPVPIVVEGNMKVGAFSIAFNDLVEQTPGIPITLTRTYDSRDRRAGDFGPGWHLALGNIRVQKSRNLGANWYQTEPSGGLALEFYYVQPLVERLVTVVMPDGETHRFRAGVLVKKRQGDPDNASYPVPAQEGSFRFYPLGDTTSTLEPLDASNNLYDRFWLEGTGHQDLYAGMYGDFDYIPYNASRFRLTTADGTILLLDERLGLLELRDRTGNRLVIHRRASDGRIESIDSVQAHADGPITRTVEINRLPDGRIDTIEDLAGRTLDYLYDPQGRLASFTDRESNTTQFRYEMSDAPAHPRFSYLTKILDPRGLPALRSEYDDDGRLVKQIDADGNETVFDRGIGAFGRFEKITDRLGQPTTYFYDDRGNVTTKVDALGATTTYDYYPDSDRVKFEEDHYGNVKGFAYDARGNVTVEILGASRAQDPAAATTGYITRTTYTAFSAPLSITDADGRVQSFTYHPANQQLLTHTVGQLAPGASPEIVAAPTATTTYTYHPDGNLHTVTDALGNVTTTIYTYGFSDPAYPGAVKRVTTTVVDPAGAAGSDPHNATATTLRTTHNYHDAQENLLATVTPRTLADGTVEIAPTRYAYDAENRLRFTVLPDGRIQETRYTSFGQTDKTLEWPVGTHLATLIAAGPTGPTTGARVTSMTYDTCGNVERTTLPDGTFTATGYDAEGRVVWSQDARGHRRFSVYDQVGRLRFTIHPDADDGTFNAAPVSADDPRLANNPRSETRYDLVGRVSLQIDERGATTETRYFADGTVNAGRREQLVQQLDDADLVTTYAYYPSGQVRSVKDPGNNTTHTRYDSHGRPVRILHPATDEHPATETATTYNPLGQRVATADQEGKLTRYRHDALGRLLEVRQYLDQSLAAGDSGFTQPASATGIVSTTYAYDEAGNQVAQADARGHVTRYEHDAIGRRLKRFMPPGSAGVPPAFEQLRYNAWGDLWQRDDFAGRTTTFGYDTLHRLKTKQADPAHPSLLHAHAVALVEYDYDDAGAREAARTYNATGALLYTETTPRDERGRIDYKDTSSTRLDYDYHANGLLKDVVSSSDSGVNIGYRYDPLNRLSHVDDATRGLPVRTTAYTYTANGSLESFTHANGLRHAYRYDSLNRLRRLDVGQAAGLASPALSTVLQSFDQRLRASGHRREVVETGTTATTRTATYAYDDLYRLTGETVTGDPLHSGAVSYTLDKVGNREARVSSIVNLPSRAGVTFNGRDQLPTDTYDANGNTLTGVLSGTGILPVGSSVAVPDVYDFEDRLIVRTRADGSTIRLGYDADGLRVRKTILNAAAQLVSKTHYVLDTNNLTGYAQVVEERTTDVNGTAFKTYTYGHDLLSETTHATLPATRYFLYDGGGSVRALVDETGSITDRYTYDAFGVLLSHVGTSDNAYLYRGEQWDADLGLYYLRARFMNPDSGRFWNQDTYEGQNTDPASLHKYLYAHADPVNGTDPSGHMTLVEIQTGLAITARNAMLTTPRIINTANKVFEQLFVASMLFNLSAAVSDPSLTIAALSAAGYQHALVKQFKSVKNRKPFAVKRLFRLARFVAEAASTSGAQVPRKVNGFPDFSGATHPVRGTVFIGKLTGSRSADDSKANRKRGLPQPANYTWHHHEVVGIMQLVRTDVHGPVRHIGGVFYWEVAMNKKYP